MQHSQGHQECGVHCDLWVQRLASSQSSKNKSTVIICLQWKDYVSFAMRLNGKMKQQIVVVVAEDLCLPRCVTLSRFKLLLEDPLFLVNVRSCNSFCAFKGKR